MYPQTAQRPTVYASSSNPEHAFIMAYYWCHDYHVLDVIDTDHQQPSLIPRTLPCVVSYAKAVPQRLYGPTALAFLTSYIEYMESIRPDPVSPRLMQ